MPLDRINLLALQLATSPQSFAIFIGAGASVDAGIPSAGQIVAQIKTDLFQAEHERASNPEEVNQWWGETEFADLHFSDLLERIFPAEAARREYLQGIFGAATPGETHQRLAEMARQGLIRVIITTNFDRLIEQALDAAGVQYATVARPEEIPEFPRERTESWILKLHGDYQRPPIRVTEEELMTLSPAMAAELQSILRAYGLIVMGYRGEDQGVLATLQAIRPRDGLYWVARGERDGSARELVTAHGGHVIVRESAATFCGDLVRKIQALAEVPMGETPDRVRAEAIVMLRAGDEIGLREELKRLTQRVEQTWGEARQSGEEIGAVLAKMEGVGDQLGAFGLAVLEYGSPDLVRRSVRTLVLLFDLGYPDLADGRIMAIPWVVASQLFYLWGAFCLMERKAESLAQLLGVQVQYGADNRIETLLENRLIFYPATFDRNGTRLIEYIATRVRASEFFKEVFRGDGRLRTALATWNLLLVFRHETDHPCAFYRVDSEGFLREVKKIGLTDEGGQCIRTIFNETPEEFRGRHNERADMIRAYLRNKIVFPDVFGLRGLFDRQ